jgi:hypothetical protein
MLPDQNIGIVVPTNRDPSPVAPMLCHVVFDRLCAKEPIAWYERFHTPRQQFLAQQEESRQVRTSARKPNTRPSHALPD